MPSVVCYKGDNNYETAVGRAAYKAAKETGNTLIFDIKRLLGKLPNDPKVNNLKPDWPFEIGTDDAERIRIKRNASGADDLYGEELSAIVLEKMKSIAELEANATVSKAVVTVPAYFTKA